jgi:hypothetical protein
MLPQAHPNSPIDRNADDIVPQPNRPGMRHILQSVTPAPVCSRG